MPFEVQRADAPAVTVGSICIETIQGKTRTGSRLLRKRDSFRAVPGFEEWYINCLRVLSVIDDNDKKGNGKHLRGVDTW
jgi:hypothetical protein